MFPLSPGLWLAVGAGVLVLALGAGVKIQTSRLEACKTSAAAFVASVKAQGELAAKEAARVDLANRKAMEVANGEYAKVKGDLASTYAAYRKLRNDNTARRTLPEAPRVAGNADRTCYRSADVIRAVDAFEAGLSESFGILETGIPQITEQGDSARVRLIGAMKWATSLAR